MKPLSEGQTVTVIEGGESVDGIVFHVVSFLKAVVVVPEGDGGAFRTVHRKALSERTEPGEHDEALRKLIRRTSSAAGGPVRGGGARPHGAQAHTRGADHRPTGR